MSSLMQDMLGAGSMTVDTNVDIVFVIDADVIFLSINS